MKKIEFEPFKKWITLKVESILGLDDEILTGLIFNLLQKDQFPDARFIYVQLVPFLERHVRKFMVELWELLTSAQEGTGVPKEMIEQLREELNTKNFERKQFSAQIRKRYQDNGEPISHVNMRQNVNYPARHMPRETVERRGSRERSREREDKERDREDRNKREKRHRSRSRDRRDRSRSYDRSRRDRRRRERSPRRERRRRDRSRERSRRGDRRKRKVKEEKTRMSDSPPPPKCLRKKKRSVSSESSGSGSDSSDSDSE